MKKQKFLFILPWLPYPLESGGNQALFNGIYAIKDDFEIHLTYKANNDDSYLENEKKFQELIPATCLHPFFCDSKYPLWYRVGSKIKTIIKKVFGVKNVNADSEESICTRWMSTVLPLQKEWLNHVMNLCSNHSFDILQVEMPWMVSQILALPKNSTKIYVHHELGFVRREQEQKHLKNSAYVNACRIFADRVEIGLLNMYDAVVTLSSIDKQKLLSHGVNVPVYSSLATINLRNEFDICIGDGKRLSFIGPCSHSPNYVGIIWFLENCWKELKEQSADYKLSIYGNWKDKYIKEISSRFPDVEFCGFVEDLRAAIKGSIMIVPLTIGSGIRMKILEACSIGAPFVSTSVGAEGIPVISGKHCYIADTPKDFVDSLVRLQDVDIQKSFITQAREMVEKVYSVEALRRNRINIYNEILSEIDKIDIR